MRDHDLRLARRLAGLLLAMTVSCSEGGGTLLRLGGRNLDALFLAEGEVVPAPRRDDLCRTQVDVQLEPGQVASLLDRPLGNHLVLVPGRFASRLRTYWDWAVA